MLSNYKTKLTIVLLLNIIGIFSYAQSSRLRTANAEFEKMAYAQALRYYEAFLGSANNKKSKKKRL